MISLGTQLHRVRRRLLGIGAAAAAVWGLAAVTILLLLGAWLDLLWEFPPQWWFPGNPRQPSPICPRRGQTAVS